MGFLSAKRKRKETEKAKKAVNEEDNLVSCTIIDDLKPITEEEESKFCQ